MFVSDDNFTASHRVIFIARELPYEDRVVTTFETKNFDLRNSPSDYTHGKIGSASTTIRYSTGDTFSFDRAFLSRA